MVVDSQIMTIIKFKTLGRRYRDGIKVDVIEEEEERIRLVEMNNIINDKAEYMDNRD